MLKAIIFDVDGTLSETEEVHRHAFNAAFKEKGLEWHWDQQLYKKLLDVSGGKERIRYFIELHDRQYLETDDLDGFIRDIHLTKTENYTQLVLDGQAVLRPGIRQLISDTANSGLRLAIATTTSVPNVEALLQAAYGSDGMGLFEVICAGDSVPAKKPAPDIYISALEQLGLKADECIAIEDSRNGLLSADAAGIATIIMSGVYTEDQCFDEAACIIEDLTTLTFDELISATRTASKKSESRETILNSCEPTPKTTGQRPLPFRRDIQARQGGHIE
jgi:HAD superfamily hydrolase (TIGR01509 family)